MNEQTNKQTNKRVNERANERTNEQTQYIVIWIHTAIIIIELKAKISAIQQLSLASILLYGVGASQEEKLSSHLAPSLPLPPWMLVKV